MRICFYVAVFSIFASVGALVLLMSTSYLSPLQIVLNILIMGGFAIGYAAVSIWQRYWVIPVLGVIEGFLFAILGAHYHAALQLAPRNSPLQQQLQILGVIGIVSVVLGYVLFIVFFARQGARYFRVQNEIAMAGEIHRTLVPPIHKTTTAFEIYGVSIPSGEVGGDLVDVAGDGHSWTGYVADVSGHGVSAGLLMAMFKTAVRTGAKDVDSGKLLSEVHRALYPLKTPNMFATVGVLHWTGQRFNLALAGHPPLLHYSRSRGEVEEYPSADMPVGILADQTFTSREVACESGDVLLLITDGLTEVFDKSGKEMGIGPLKDVLAKSARQPLPDLFASLRQAALNFGHQDDDQTMLMIRCL
jgi:sigma-B regulation protein RsbU (phosphoserine phosphatase)